MFNRRNKLTIFNWSLVVIWMALIFWSSSISSFAVVTGGEEQRSDLVSSAVHIILYAILTWLLMRAFLTSKVSIKKSIVYAFLVAVIYGITDECHQYFVPGREMHFGDWLLDVAGVLVVFYWYRFRLKK